MYELDGAEVWRGGKTSRYLSQERSHVHLTQARMGAANGISLRFNIRSKGGGSTKVDLRLAANNFWAICQEMAEVDRKGAMRAMSAELKRQIDKQDEADRKTRLQLEHLAHTKSREGTIDWAVCQGIRDLNKELDRQGSNR